MPTPPPPTGHPDFVALFKARNSKFIASVTSVDFDGFVRQIAHTRGPSPFVALVKDAPNGRDTVEIWNVNSRQMQGETSLVREAGIEPRVVLSPDGLTVARITRFPRPSLDIASVRPGRRNISMPLSDHSGTSTLVGFLNAPRLTIRWDRGAQEDMVETWDVLSLRVLNQLPVMHAAASLSNGLASPDGRDFVIAVNAPHEGPQIRVYSLLSTQGEPRLSPIENLDSRLAENPSAMAFSHDGRRFAILYERGNEALLTTWKIKATDGTLPPPRQFKVPLRSPRPVSRHGLDWLTAYNAWLVMGDVIVNSDTGEIKGELDPPDFGDQWTVDVHTIAYRFTAQERAYLALVKLVGGGPPADSSSGH